MKILFPLLLLIFLISSCEKEIETPPCCTCDVPYSESGLNVLDCYMDGSPWSVCDSNKNKITPRMSFFYDNGGGADLWQFSNTKFVNGIEEIVYVTFRSPAMGVIPLKREMGSKTPFGFVNAWFNKGVKYKGWFRTDSSEYNYLEITKFDTINHIISGRFDCTLKRSGSTTDSTTIKITNGIFDFQYK